MTQTINPTTEPAAAFAALPARNLDRSELSALVANLAARPQLWREHLGFDDEHRHFASLYRDEYVDVWVLCWTTKNDTGWHDHDTSSGAMAVVQGCLLEHNLSIQASSPATVLQCGSVSSFGPDHIHRLTGELPDSVSIHAYSPPLSRMGQYSVGPDGVLHRTSISYADELRPAESGQP